MRIYSKHRYDYSPFNKLFPDSEGVHVDENFKDYEPPGIVVFWGGGDIHPSLYGRKGVKKVEPQTPSIVDEVDVKMFINAVECDMPILGVCRGAQLACVMAGGILIQDVDGHNVGNHMVETTDKKRILLNSSHHQMMYPWDTDHELIAYTCPPRSTKYLGLTEDEIEAIPTTTLEGVDKPIMIEPEMVYFKKIKALGVQYHPEWYHTANEANLYLKTLVHKYLLPETH